MKKKFLLALSLIAIMCCFLAITASAEEGIHTYYVVASQDSNTAVSLKAEGKSTIVLSEVYSSTASLSDTDWIAQFNDGDHIELIFAESIVEDVAQNTEFYLKKQSL